LTAASRPLITDRRPAASRAAPMPRCPACSTTGVGGNAQREFTPPSSNISRYSVELPSGAKLPIEVQTFVVPVRPGVCRTFFKVRPPPLLGQARTRPGWLKGRGNTPGGARPRRRARAAPEGLHAAGRAPADAPPSCACAPPQPVPPPASAVRRLPAQGAPAAPGSALPAARRAARARQRPDHLRPGGGAAAAAWLAEAAAIGGGAVSAQALTNARGAAWRTEWRGPACIVS
jgi:hypothetical protein